MTSGATDVLPEFVLNTPVVFLVFNRPEVTLKAFEAIRRARPPKLFVVADGPRPHKAGEAEKCLATRAILDRVDWECEVFRNFSDTNLGCMQRVSTGLDWAFGLAEEAIVLEDDCIPDPTFFRFCQELLERYRHDTRIGCISGNNFQFGKTRGPYGYYFSHYNHCWGWASWRRAWNHFDREMTAWPAMREGNYLRDILGSRSAANYWANIYNLVSEYKIDSWAYRWTFAAWREGVLTVLPERNLVSNIGFDQSGTHTREASPFSAMPTFPMEFPLRHPPFIIRDVAADRYTQKTMFVSHNVLRVKGLALRFKRLLRLFRKP